MATTATFSVFTFTDSQVTLHISTDSTYPYYRAYIRPISSTAGEYKSWQVSYGGGTLLYIIDGLSPDTEYSVNVAYGIDGELNSGWIMPEGESISFTTNPASGSGDGGGGTGDGDASYVWVYYYGSWRKAVPWIYYYGSWYKTQPWVYTGWWRKASI